MIDQWYERYASELTGFIRSKGFTQEDADDLCSAVFMEAVRSQPADISPRGWLYVVTKNKMFEAWRKAGRHAPDVAMGDWDIVAPDVADRPSIPLDCLTEEQRAVIRFRFLEEKTIEETAEILGICPSSVKGRQARALARLRAAPKIRTIQAPKRPRARESAPEPNPLCANGDLQMAYLLIDDQALCATCALEALRKIPPVRDDVCSGCSRIALVVIQRRFYCASCALNLPFSVLAASIAPNILTTGKTKFRRYPANQPPVWAHIQ